MTVSLTQIVLLAVQLDTLAAYYRDVLQLPQAQVASDGTWVEFRAGSLLLRLETGGQPKDARGATKLIFATFDVDATHRLWSGRGAVLAPVQEAHGVRFADGVDPEGNRFQLTNRGLIVTQPIAMTSPPPAGAHAPVPMGSPAAMLQTPGAPGLGVLRVESPLARQARLLITTQPEIPVYGLEGRPGIAVFMRDVLSAINATQAYQVPEPELSRALGQLGGVGMVARLGQKPRRVVVFGPDTLSLNPEKVPHPLALPLASSEVFPLG
ncbi:MAG: hypothetical protein GEEBNDBF_01934 [bacterium]|nr:hypothetical protein [bacterium]